MASIGLSNRVNDNNVKWYTLIAACFALFMAMLDNLVVNIALPTISRDLDARATQLQWVISAYTLVFASLQITAGGLGDKFGRKRWFMIGLVIFTVVSAIAAFSNSMNMLITMRALQGLGAALIMPLSLSLISNAFPPEERGRAIGIWSAVSVSSIALGPVIGGAIVEYFHWGWIFLINVPIGIIALLVTQAVVRESRDESGTVATDVPGTILITAGIAALTWGLIQAGERGWTDTWILAAFLAAAIILPVFVWVEMRAERPMIPMSFFRSRTFVGANIDSFMIAFLITGVSFFMTLYQQNIHGFSPIRTGLALVPMVAVMMVFSPLSGSMVNKLGPRRRISFGMIVTGIGTGLFLMSGVGVSYWRILPAFLLMGFGMSFIWAPMTTAVLNSVSSEKSGIASAVNGSLREIGTAFGVALLGTLANRAYKAEFNGNSDIQALRASGGEAAAPVIDLVGAGMNNAGRVLGQLIDSGDYPQLASIPAQVVQTLEHASAEAFMVGMDRAIIFSTAGIIIAAVISYFLIEDAVVERALEPDGDREPRPGDVEFVPGAAD
ncbi:MAG: DHA2 family efflux MFS transporter permease subunit [Thermomicrobiales bacterium]|nr:MAG: DHA2 family efflux MFS transporter permease subunit [Thermomicrobiales bacterium]